MHSAHGEESRNPLLDETMLSSTLMRVEDASDDAINFLINDSVDESIIARVGDVDAEELDKFQLVNEITSERRLTRTVTARLSEAGIDVFEELP